MTLRASGYHVFFRAAIAGGILFLFSYTILLPLQYAAPQAVALWEHSVPVPYAGTSFLSALLGFILPIVGNLFYGEKRLPDEQLEKAETRLNYSW